MSGNRRTPDGRRVLRCHKVAEPGHQPHDWSSSFLPAHCPGANGDVEWFHRTGHCGACGQPGVYCLCRTPCGCSRLHECGSGLVADPVEVFAEVPVGDDQPELFA